MAPSKLLGPCEISIDFVVSQGLFKCPKRRNINRNNIIGLIGGMGPYASAYFYKLLLKKSGDLYGAKNNNDYPEILIDSLPVPDFISDTKELKTAKRMLISRVEKLNEFGCNVIAILCNTAHILHSKLVTYSKTYFPSIVSLTVKRAQKMGMKKVGLLVTKTTAELQLYNKELAKMGIEAINPSKQMQATHERIIRHVIAKGETNLFETELYKMTQKFIQKEHIDGVILGCTELPLVFPTNKFSNVIDCLDVLADELLSKYYKKNEERGGEIYDYN